ncbi:MAG: universal stress protein [Cyanobacteria bacterium P01_A01_bin.123]
MLNRILVAIDQSVASQRAFDAALELAKALGAELILIHTLDVFDPASPERPTMPVGSYSMGLDDILRKNYDRQWAEFVQHYDALLKQKTEAAIHQGIAATFEQPYGRPGPAICKTAETDQIDLIVIGSHGRTGLREVLLGSVSNHVLHHAPCSVMVVHPDDRDDHALPRERSELNAIAMS